MLQAPASIQNWIHNHVPQGSEVRNRIRFETGFGPAADSILDFAARAGVVLIVMSVRSLWTVTTQASN